MTRVAGYGGQHQVVFQGKAKVHLPDTEKRLHLLIESDADTLEAIVAAKGLAHWIASGLPLAIASPLLGLMLGIEPAANVAIVFSMWASLASPSKSYLMSSAIPTTVSRGTTGNGIRSCG